MLYYMHTEGREPMTPEQFINFCSRCTEVTVSEGVADFYAYAGNRGEYHTQRGEWFYPDKLIIDFVNNHIEEWKELETEEDKIEFLQEFVGQMPCGDIPEGSCQSDYDIVHFDTDFHSVRGITPEEHTRDYQQITFVEDYPYRYGTYSGRIDMKTLEFIEFGTDGDMSPCGGPEALYVHIPHSFLSKLP